SGLRGVLDVGHHLGAVLLLVVLEDAGRGHIQVDVLQSHEAVVAGLGRIVHTAHRDLDLGGGRVHGPVRGLVGERVVAAEVGIGDVGEGSVDGQADGAGPRPVDECGGERVVV